MIASFQGEELRLPEYARLLSLELPERIRFSLAA